MVRASTAGPFSIWVDEDDRLLFHAMVERSEGPLEPRAQTREALAALCHLAAMPVVGRRDDGSWLACYFGWDFSSARVEPVRCALSVDTVLRGGVPIGESYGAARATYWVDGMIWRLSWPHACPFPESASATTG
jgi:hypothetical protein